MLTVHKDRLEKLLQAADRIVIADATQRRQPEDKFFMTVLDSVASDDGNETGGKVRNYTKSDCYDFEFSSFKYDQHSYGKVYMREAKAHIKYAMRDLKNSPYDGQPSFVMVRDRIDQKGRMIGQSDE